MERLGVRRDPSFIDDIVKRYSLRTDAAFERVKQGYIEKVSRQGARRPS